MISIVGLIILFPIIVTLIVLCTIDTGKPFFIQKRVGKHLKPFFMIKFRSMNVNSPSKPTHLISQRYISLLGRIIRYIKFDEIPQLINVIKGEMSIVGPRPCLPSQKKLIKERKKLNIYNHQPGITGLAQIKGIDMSNISQLVTLEDIMLQRMNIKFYIKIILLTPTHKLIG